MSRAVAAAAGVLVALLLVAEVVALPLATRVFGRVVASCVETESFAVTAVDRPVVPRLLLGRARGVELEATGLQLAGVRVDDVELSLPQAYLPWAQRVPASVPDAELRLTLTEADLEAAVRDRLPFPQPVTVELVPDVARLGAPGTPVAVELGVRAGDDGSLVVRPVAGDPALWERLGLEAGIGPLDGTAVRDVAIGDGVVSGEVALAAAPGIGDGQGCERPVAVAHGWRSW